MRNPRWNLGPLWVDQALPLAVGVLCALAVTREGGPFWTSLIASASCWGVWQLARRFQRGLVVRVLLVTALGVAILVYVFLFFSVHTARLQAAISEAGVEVNAVSSHRNEIVVSIRPVSWGPERNQALRAIFAAAHAHAQWKKRVVIRWGDAMTTSINMKDIEAFVGGKVTYREMLNRLDWSGTPDVLPDDSTRGQDARLIHAIGMANGKTGP